MERIKHKGSRTQGLDGEQNTLARKPSLKASSRAPIAEQNEAADEGYTGRLSVKDGEHTGQLPDNVGPLNKVGSGPSIWWATRIDVDAASIRRVQTRWSGTQEQFFQRQSKTSPPIPSRGHDVRLHCPGHYHSISLRSSMYLHSSELQRAQSA